MKLIAVLSVLLTAHLQSVWGCSCLPTHPQVHFCQADYVLRVKILEQETIYADPVVSTTQRPSTEPTPEVVLDPRLNDPLTVSRYGPPGLAGRMMPAFDIADPYRAIMIVYTVYIEKVYKGDEFTTPELTVKITTPPSDGICGVTNLVRNKRYILAGQVINGELSIMSCNFVKNVRDITRRQKQGLRYHWKKLCGECEVSVCFGQYCPDFAIPNLCMLDISDEEFQCESDYARCTRDSDGTCLWYGKKDFRDCKVQRAMAATQDETFLP